MISNRPYLVRALYEWILDNGMTPYLLADTTVSGTQVPASYIENNRIILNLLPDAVHDLILGNEVISFSARFGGKSCDIFVPVNAVLAIYAKENGKGLIFPDDELADKGEEQLQDNAVKTGKSHLKVIK